MPSITHRFQWIALIFWLTASLTTAQEVEEHTQSIESTPPNGEILSESSEKLQAVQRALASLDIVERDIRARQKRLQKDTLTEREKTELTAEIDDLDQRKAKLELQLAEIASDVDLSILQREPTTQFDWAAELQELFRPLLEELKELSEEPREIEQLRDELEKEKQKLDTLRRALSNVETLLPLAQRKEVKQRLQQLQSTWNARAEEITNRVAFLEYRLEEKLEERSSFISSAQNLILAFFRTRGRNLLFAIAGFFLVFLLLRWGHRKMHQLYPVRKRASRSIYFRLVDVLFYVFSVIGALGAFLFILYVSDDWVLLGLAILFLIGVAWTAKQGLPMYWEQAKLLLNLGTVREKERVVYEGIPWKIEQLSFYSLLVNPELRGGELRLPIRKLGEMVSRQIGPEERWFPCREGDWVILSDETRGKVIQQSPEMVHLVLLGGSQKTYPTSEFLELHPNNLSTNFRIIQTFGVDYQHQEICTTTIPETFREELHAGLISMGWEKQILSLKVEFKEAGSSSLDYRILADFSGDLAAKHDVLERAIQKFLVESCNRHGWIIPFTQITLHQASSQS